MINNANRIYIATLSLLLLLFLGGCAVGRGPAGEIVIGPKVGQLVETTGEAVGAAAQAAAAFLPEPFGTLVTYAVPTIVGGLGIGAAARAKKKAEDRAWEEARTQQLADFAIRKGVGDG